MKFIVDSAGLSMNETMIFPSIRHYFIVSIHFIIIFCSFCGFFNHQLMSNFIDENLQFVLQVDVLLLIRSYGRNIFGRPNTANEKKNVFIEQYFYSKTLHLFDGLMRKYGKTIKNNRNNCPIQMH